MWLGFLLPFWPFLKWLDNSFSFSSKWLVNEANHVEEERKKKRHKAEPDGWKARRRRVICLCGCGASKQMLTCSAAGKRDFSQHPLPIVLHHARRQMWQDGPPHRRTGDADLGSRRLPDNFIPFLVHTMTDTDTGAHMFCSFDRKFRSGVLGGPATSLSFADLLLLSITSFPFDFVWCHPHGSLIQINRAPGWDAGIHGTHRWIHVALKGSGESCCKSPMI